MSVEAFVEEVRAYCAFVETAATLDLPARLTAARARLLALYSASLSLPHVAPTGDDAEPTPATPSWPGFGDSEHYWEVFDPYELDEPVCGSLSDDVLDVYLDVRCALVAWDEGRKVDAIWTWRYLRDLHWGDHAVDALRALHHACKHSD